MNLGKKSKEASRTKPKIFGDVLKANLASDALYLMEPKTPEKIGSF